MKIILGILSILLSCGLFAQKEEISELNQIFDGVYEFSWAKSGLKIDFLKEGDVYREEYLKTSEINWEDVGYNEEREGIVLKCNVNYPKCIDRKIIKTKSRNPYSSTTLKTDPEQSNNVIEILKKIASP